MGKPKLEVVQPDEPTTEAETSEQIEVTDEEKMYAAIQNELELRLEKSGFDPANIKDPMGLAKAEIQKVVGGEGAQQATLLVYAAATSRVLEPIPHVSFPVHLYTQGPSGTGKNSALKKALRLLPPEAVIDIPAATPKALIYLDRTFRHTVVVFEESDSLPQGSHDEDSSGASAIRGIMTENRMVWMRPETNPRTGKTKTVTIERPGPTLLMTTSIRPLESQLETRVLKLMIPEDKTQIEAAMKKIGETFANQGRDIVEVNPDLLALQIFLQVHAPIVVDVPFSPALAAALAPKATTGKMYRDLIKLCVLVQAVAAMNVGQREHWRDEEGRLNIRATFEDYAIIQREFEAILGQNLGGVGKSVRKVVEAVAKIARDTSKQVKLGEIERKAGLNSRTVTTAVQQAIRARYLTDAGNGRQGAAYALQIGERLPAEVSLPSVEEVKKLARGLGL